VVGGEVKSLPFTAHSRDLYAGFLLISEIGSDRISRTSKEL
jgi:hypothetical protein